MYGIAVGVVLIVIGLAFFIAVIVRSKKVSVSAIQGSMAVGGNNSGVMQNVNQGSAPPLLTKSHGHGLTLLAIVVEVVGIGVTVWHALHLAA